MPVASFAGQLGEARPEVALPEGTLFWHVVGGGGPTATWQITIPRRESGRPIVFASVPDYNGDGFADVALGVPAPPAGRVLIFFGGPELPGLVPDVTLEGGPDFGCGVGAVGDANGDGFTELAVGAGCGEGSGTGVVTIYLGGPTGPVKGPMLYPGNVTAGFGTSMASAGDFNGDGYGDVIVGGREFAQIFLGSPAGVRTTSAFGLSGLPSDPSNLTSFPATTVHGPGDVNGDGLADLVVTFRFDPGRLYLGTGGGFRIQDITSSGNGFDFAGDVNGDGFEDFNNFDLMPGSPTGVDTSQSLDIQPTMPHYAAAGDLNADGFADVIQLVGQATGLPEHYRIVFGQDNPCRETLCLPFFPFGTPGLTPDDFAIIAGVGDVNGDAFADLVASRPSIGEAYLYLGSVGVPMGPARTWTGPVGFGASVPALYGTATFYGEP